MKINNRDYNFSMHALAKHREVEEENFFLSFLCYGAVSAPVILSNVAI
jgi:hypothetical protein